MCIYLNRFQPQIKQNSEEGDGGQELTVPGYKWRLVIAYEGTRFSGFLFLSPLNFYHILLYFPLLRMMDDIEERLFNK